MSRIGKNPVSLPDGVTVEIMADSIKAKGKLGELMFPMNANVTISREEAGIVVRPANESKAARSMWGTMRSQVSNMVQGVSEGFTVDLEVNGVGYRAAVQGRNLNLQLGFSHDVLFPIPEGINIKCTGQIISITGADKQKVGQIAANIRKYRKPEPYKGKGVKYVTETILRKEGKKK